VCRTLLFHGTRFPYAVFEYWTQIPRGDFIEAEDEGCGAILVFDRKRLAVKVKLVHTTDPLRRIDEKEMRVYGEPVEALGDPARLRLLVTLAGSEVCVTELADLEDALSDTHVPRLVQSAMEHAAEKV
jgi:hypothetical protein